MRTQFTIAVIAIAISSVGFVHADDVTSKPPLTEARRAEPWTFSSPMKCGEGSKKVREAKTVVK